MHSHIDYAYPWYLSYGHLLVAVIALVFLAAAWKLRWGKIALVLGGLIAVWSLSAAAWIYHGMDLSGPMEMPTANFLKSGAGTILDMGAGTGRSSIMILEARPKATLVALDLFTQQYEDHFGKGFSGQEKLMENFRAAGLEDRVKIQAGDMRKLPFEAAAFDGIISCYAIDHLGDQGIRDAMGEAARVLKPNGEFLMAVIAKDRFLTYTFGPLLLHSRMRASTSWPEYFNNAGFDVVEQGTRPATLYYVARKRPTKTDGENKNDH